ncbi:Putative amidoligase enzyme [Septoria linicola]|uniref:Amidoligase enzyme n=1 Tax=Septoria linicola TaxID=215465 RepID=A0A9Q9B6W7_9PEZI|nr:putative amidoligase enzyme [Septoria linicola]USW59365.1 Putative amidoligase enzyme [Septoria linicola]
MASRWADIPEEEVLVDREQNRLPLDLTLGVEFEFVLLQDLRKDNTSRLFLGQKMIADTLMKGLRGKCATCGKEHDLQLPVQSADTYTSADYRQWTTEQDESVNVGTLRSKYPKEFEHIRVHACELRSRILRVNRNLQTTEDPEVPGHRHEISYQEEIKIILDRLRTTFNSPSGKAGWRMLVNDSCGFHVHLGNDNKCFPLPTAKNVLSLYLANEKAIDAIHSLDRIDGSTLGNDPRREGVSPELRNIAKPPAYNKPFSFHFAYLLHQVVAYTQLEDASRWPKKRILEDPEFRELCSRNDLCSWLTIIDEAEDIRDFFSLQTKYHNHSSAIDTMGLLPYDERGVEPNFGRKLTFEFRQHAGTVDSTEALAWIDVLTHIVNYAHENTEDDVQYGCVDDWRNPDYETLHFLKKVGFEPTDPVFQHYQHVLGLNADASATSYADECREREELMARSFGDDDLFLGMMDLNAKLNHRNRDLYLIRKRIEAKFLAGCYGQFEEGSFLVALMYPEDALTEEERMKLTQGWRPAIVPSDSSPDDVSDDGLFAISLGEESG